MILFITRKYPPSIGGMQRLSYCLTTRIAQRVPALIISWGGSQLFLPIFLLYALLRALVALAIGHFHLVHVGDPILAPLGFLLHRISGLPVATTAHGLDVTYQGRLYQQIVLPFLRRLGLVVCISESTRSECVARGVPYDRTAVVTVGIDVEPYRLAMSPEERATWLRRWTGQQRAGHVILAVGRLVPRKGGVFLVSQVLPRLRARRQDWLCLIVGQGPERDRIAAAVQEHELREAVHLLGQLPDEELRAAYALADLFVMPNVPVSGDVEGFGLVLLEARASGLPIVAARLQGIVEAAPAGEGVVLVEPGNAEQFAASLDQMLSQTEGADHRRRRRDEVAATFGWERVVDMYLDLFARLSRGGNGKGTPCV